jgi:hypothetical protein
MTSQWMGQTGTDKLGARRWWGDEVMRRWVPACGRVALEEEESPFIQSQPFATWLHHDFCLRLDLPRLLSRTTHTALTEWRRCVFLPLAAIIKWHNRQCWPCVCVCVGFSQWEVGQNTCRTDWKSVSWTISEECRLLGCYAVWLL